MLKRISHEYTIKETAGSRFQVLMILFEHDTQESSVNLEIEVEQLRAQGVNAVTSEEAIKGMTSGGLERFLEERRQKFISRVLDKNIKTLKNKERIRMP